MKNDFKGLLILFVAFWAMAISSCGSKSKDPKPKEDPNSVTINGTAYTTVTIGSQVWTTVNYKGASGYTASETAIYGSYFTRSQANAINLPAGWRVPTIADYSMLIHNYTSVMDGQGFYYAFSGESAPLCSSSGWTNTQGTNTSGFNALPAGSYAVGGGQIFYLPEKDALFVTSDFRPPSETQPAIYSVQISPNIAAIIQRPDPEARALSVRFVKDK